MAVVKSTENVTEGFVLMNGVAIDVDKHGLDLLNVTMKEYGTPSPVIRYGVKGGWLYNQYFGDGVSSRVQLFYKEKVTKRAKGKVSLYVGNTSPIAKAVWDVLQHQNDGFNCTKNEMHVWFDTIADFMAWMRKNFAIETNVAVTPKNTAQTA